MNREQDERTEMDRGKRGPGSSAGQNFGQQRGRGSDLDERYTTAYGTLRGQMSEHDT